MLDELEQTLIQCIDDAIKSAEKYKTDPRQYFFPMIIGALSNRNKELGKYSDLLQSLYKLYPHLKP